MSKEDYIYKNFVFEDSSRDGEATYQSDCAKTRLLNSRWEFVNETITVRGNNFVVILKMRKKNLFFKLEEIKDFTEVFCSSYYREKDFKEFKESCDIETIEEYRKYFQKEFSKIENNEELLYIASYCYHKLHKIVEKFESIKQNLEK